LRGGARMGGPRRGSGHLPAPRVETMQQLTGFLLLFPLFVLAVVVHEVSHGWAALGLGDRTALEAGRLTLNPLRHVDPIGTLLLPVFLQMINAPFVFGWAKPVPVNPLSFRCPRQGMLWVGAAGPAANFLLAAAAAFLSHAGAGVLSGLAVDLLRALALINLVLGVFNLLPVPPLDGSRVLLGLVPPAWAGVLGRLERWGILLVILLLYTGALDRILGPSVWFLARALGL